ncbi:aldo/keto reductase [Fusibacter tunisiensis]|uniref:Aldo/keto reductase-like oxidoreductase n=1 Tax=Fusibacter tunisiensis TaxID=1008308 RepID=A0ABS2MQ63_9FIRM|nr:aldo/keto reductase [Fusibacter tunisiensis]MBM7561526.1 putative aldo/keto reductase-like oxidoreductase [Fusibacter tunisiensis]
MKYRVVEKSGDKISILGYGGMRFSTKGGLIDEAKATTQLRNAIDQGVNYVDTAYFYHGGQSETFIGKALQDGYREKVYIATKLPPWLVQTEADMHKIFETQRKRLQTDVIDYYLLHALNSENWEKFLKLDVLSFLAELKASGKIRNVGFSFHGDRDNFVEIIDAYDWDFCQIQYNFLDVNNQAGTYGLKYAADRGIAVMVMEPLRGGSLVSKLPDGIQKLYKSHEVSRTPAEWALKWIWNQAEVTCVLSGMNEDAHIQANIAYASEMEAGHFADAENNLMDQARAIYLSLQKVPCTGCQYCMPCPFGVDIPRCFDLYNSKHLIQQKTRTFYWMQLGGMNGKPSYASLCQNCGKCLDHCPQQIDIPTELKAVAKDMEGVLMKPFLKAGRFFLRLKR